MPAFHIWILLEVSLYAIGFTAMAIYTLFDCRLQNTEVQLKPLNYQTDRFLFFTEVFSHIKSPKKRGSCIPSKYHKFADSSHSPAALFIIRLAEASGLLYLRDRFHSLWVECKGAGKKEKCLLWGLYHGCGSRLTSLAQYCFHACAAYKNFLPGCKQGRCSPSQQNYTWTPW